MTGATPDGTRRYFERNPERTRNGITPIRLGRTDFLVSPVGFGGYRIHEADTEHRAALEKALASGCNLVDTSANYADGGSERLIGAVLRDLVRSGTVSRDEIVIVSKAGYIQGENLRVARERASEAGGSRAFPQVVRFSENLWHCISPEFIEDQITRSLDRLKLDRIDVFLLHNPEYFLKSGVMEPRETGHEEYYRRIETAMRHLETEVNRGRIGFYGISSNSFPEPKDAEDFTSLETVLSIASGIGPSNRFAVIQFPFNLLEPGAAFEKNNTRHGILDLALETDLGTLINRPLNAYSGNQLTRLADFPRHAPLGPGTWDDRLRRVFERTTRTEARIHEEAGLHDFYAWGHILAKQFGQVQGVTHWRDLYTRQVIPSAEDVLSRLQHQSGRAGLADQYRADLEALFSELAAYYETVAADRSEELAAALDRAAPDLASSSSLSRKAIRIYRSIPGIGCVLVGMRRPEYVSDAMTLEPPIQATHALAALEAAVKLTS